MSESRCTETDTHPQGQRTECLLEFERLKMRLAQGETIHQIIQSDIGRITSVICGDGNGNPGLGEQLRIIRSGQDRHAAFIDTHLEKHDGSTWKLWQKVSAVILFIVALAVLFINIYQKTGT